MEADACGTRAPSACGVSTQLEAEVSLHSWAAGLSTRWLAAFTVFSRVVAPVPLGALSLKYVKCGLLSGLLHLPNSGIREISFKTKPFL